MFIRFAHGLSPVATPPVFLRLPHEPLASAFAWSVTAGNRRSSDPQELGQDKAAPSGHPAHGRGKRVGVPGVELEAWGFEEPQHRRHKRDAIYRGRRSCHPAPRAASAAS